MKAEHAQRHKELKRQVQEARDELAGLKEDLPRFHTLLHEAEAEDLKLKTKGGDPQARVEQRSRVNACAELLEQQQSEIEAAEARVAELESELEVYDGMDAMSRCAKDARQAYDKLDQAVSELHAKVEPELRRAADIYRELLQARQQFFTNGRKVNRVFSYTSLHARSVTQELESKLYEVLDSLELGPDHPIRTNWPGTVQQASDSGRALPVGPQTPLAQALFRLVSQGDWRDPPRSQAQSEPKAPMQAPGAS